MANDLEMWATGIAGVAALSIGTAEFMGFDIIAKITELIPMASVGQIISGAVGLAGAFVLAKVFGLMK